MTVSPVGGSVTLTQPLAAAPAPILGAPEAFVVVGALVALAALVAFLLGRRSRPEGRAVERPPPPQDPIRDARTDAERRSDDFARSNAVMVWMADVEGRCEWFNPGWLAFTGRTLEDELAGGWEASVHPSDAPPRRATIDKALETRAAFETEYRLRRADGRYRWMLERGLPRFGQDGAFAGYVGTCIDMHDRRELERRARLLADAANIVGNTVEAEGALERVARLAVPLLADVCLIHVTAGSAEGSLQFANDDDPEHEALINELRARYPPPASVPCFPTVLRTGESMVLADVNREVLELTAQDDIHLDLMGRLKWKSALCAPLRSRGRVLGVLGLANRSDRRPLDDTDLAFAQELAQYLAGAVDSGLLLREAQSSYEQALESSRLKDEFLATLSHELRTPLNAIVGWSRLLMDGHLSEVDSARAVETINRNAAAQNQLIADMLDVSRIVSGKLRLDLRQVDPAAVVQAAVDTVMPAAQAKEITLQMLIDPGAGPITGDPDRLQQIVWNLLSNAIKFTPRNGRVLMRLERANSHVSITVEDNGPGVDPEFLPFVFDRFRQADASSTRRQGGLGLGLAIVRHLVELHGGTAHAENRGNAEGAIFSIRLPKRAVSAGPATGERHPAEEGSAPDPISLEGVTVLAVDDKLDSLDLVSAVLTRRGAHVFTCLTANEGLAMLRRERPDVVLADIEMPGQDGLTFIRKIRALSPSEGGRVPAAALTAYASSNDRTQALLAGFNMHVPKPVQPDELAAVVGRLAGRGA